MFTEGRWSWDSDAKAVLLVHEKKKRETVQTKKKQGRIQGKTVGDDWAGTVMQ